LLVIPGEDYKQRKFPSVGSQNITFIADELVWRIKIMKKDHSKTQESTFTLRSLATDLHEVYSMLSELSSHLEGGGIVQARDVEPAVSKAVPRLRNAVAMLYAATKHEKHRRDRMTGNGKPNQNPLLM
jgi:hypothetical protein